MNQLNSIQLVHNFLETLNTRPQILNYNLQITNQFINV